METSLDVAGWCGGAAVVVAYVLVSTKRLHAETSTFQLLNVVGGVLLTGTALYRGAWPNTVINVVWILFGVYALTAARRTHDVRLGHKDEAADSDRDARGVGELTST